MRVLTILLAIFMIACSQPGQESASQSFGAEITMTEPIKLAEVYSNPADYDGQEILLEGKIVEVCQKKGCWFKMTDGNHELTVKFKDYAFFVPKDAAESIVRVQGIFEAEVDDHISQESNEQSEMKSEHDHDSSPYTFTAAAVIITPEKKEKI